MSRSAPDTTPSSESSPARVRTRAVLRDAVELFVRSPVHERAEVAAFAALVEGLLPDVGFADRRRVSELLAPRPDTPPEIARRLALDTAEVAEPMIVSSPVLTANDLVQVMRCGPEHVRLVARRLDLSPDIAAVVVDAREEPPAGRSEAAAPKTTASAPKEPVRAASAPDVARASAEPPAVAPTMPMTFRVAPRVDPAARRTSETSPRGEAGRSFLALDSAGRWRALQAAAGEAAAATAPRRRVLADPVRAGERLFGAAVTRDASAFVEELTQATGIEPALARSVAEEKSGEPLAVTLLSIGIEPRRVVSILLHHFGDTVSLTQMQDLLALVERVGRRAAEHLVSTWRVGGDQRRGDVLRQTDDAERRGSTGPIDRVGAGAGEQRATPSAMRGTRV